MILQVCQRSNEYGTIIDLRDIHQNQLTIKNSEIKAGIECYSHWILYVHQADTKCSVFMLVMTHPTGHTSISFTYD